MKERAIEEQYKKDIEKLHKETEMLIEQEKEFVLLHIDW